MHFRVILDCRPDGADALQPFITVKYVEAERESDILSAAVARTKAIMESKGFSRSAIDMYKFIIEEFYPCDSKDLDEIIELSFVYYGDE